MIATVNVCCVALASCEGCLSMFLLFVRVYVVVVLCAVFFFWVLVAVFCVGSSVVPALSSPKPTSL